MIFTYYFWDFDGTLFDTYPRIFRAFMKALADNGIQADEGETMRRIKDTLGDAAVYYAAASGKNLTGDDIVAAYRRHAEEEDASGIVLYPGALEALRRVKRLGGANFLYTHRGETAWPAIERLGIRDLFADGVTALDGFPPKPDPAALLHLIGKHHLDKEKCAMAGDRRIDLDAARNAGIAGILFDPDGFCDVKTPWHYRTMGDLMDALMQP